MANPTGQSSLPSGLPLAPAALDDVPEDWADVTYTPVIAAHETHADVPVLSYVETSVITGGGGFVPTYIAPTETFIVPANRQALYALPIDNEGIMVIDGFLIEVD